LDPVSTGLFIITGFDMLTSFSAVFSTLVITHPFIIFTRDPARYNWQ